MAAPNAPLIAFEGYWHAATTHSGIMLINGVLHEAIRPVNGSGYVFWHPIKSYDGPVRYVDRDGCECAAPDAQAGGRPQRESEEGTA